MLAAAGPDGDTVKVSRPISQGSQRASHPCRVLFVCFGSSSFCSESDDGSGGFPCHLGSDDRKPGRTYAQAWGRFRCLVLRRRCASGREGEQLQQPRQRLGKPAVRAAFAVPDVLASRRAILVSAPQWPRQPRTRPSVRLCWRRRRPRMPLETALPSHLSPCLACLGTRGCSRDLKVTGFSSALGGGAM